ncbi:MAG: LTA synthase family protein [Sphingobacteriales bacterium]|nr:MAG: LTA synthase family protein [Sphingobacteriales bacterium]
MSSSSVASPSGTAVKAVSPQSRLWLLLSRLGLLVGLYALCRILFVYCNSKAWQPDVSVASLLWNGLRFDLSAIAMTNILFVVLSLIPAPFADRRGWQRLLQVLFVVVNAIALLANFVDIAYFPFSHKRMQFDALRFVTGQKGTEFYTLLPQFLTQYWYLLLLYALVVVVLVWGYRRSRRLRLTYVVPKARYYLLQGLLFIFGAGLSILMIRGGLQYIPINVANAGEQVGAQHAPAVLNTPFSVIVTAERTELPPYQYFDDKAIEPAFRGIHTPASQAPFRKKNVLVIIVESLSKRYVHGLGGTIPTPFLDSLLAQSLVFTNGFANGEESIQGIPAVLASIPSWHTEPYIYSSYANNRISSLADLLVPQGYSTAFFHGGQNGTMGFDLFSGMAGYQSYYGRSEYANDSDYDGHWGIWDEPFLQFTARKLTSLSQPFSAAVFTLNPHHPFKIPEAYRSRFAETGHPVRSAVRYVDYALSQFFNTARQQPWFRNTLFVLVADHGSHRLEDMPYTPLDDYRIPIAFYTPDGSLAPRQDSTVAAQIDILPTVLDLLQYPKPYFSLGHSLVTPESGWQSQSISFLNGIYRRVDPAYSYEFDVTKGLALYQWHTDPFCTQNLIADPAHAAARERADSALKKTLQIYAEALRGNRMYVQP